MSSSRSSRAELIPHSYVHGVHDNPVHDLVTELNIVSSRALWVAVDSAASSGQRQRSEQLRFQGPVESDVMSTIANNVSVANNKTGARH